MFLFIKTPLHMNYRTDLTLPRTQSKLYIWHVNYIQLYKLFFIQIHKNINYKHSDFMTNPIIINESSELILLTKCYNVCFQNNYCLCFHWIKYDCIMIITILFLIQSLSLLVLDMRSLWLFYIQKHRSYDYRIAVVCSMYMLVCKL